MRTKRSKRTESLRDEALRTAEDRMELLETIHGIVEKEVDKQVRGESGGTGLAPPLPPFRSRKYRLCPRLLGLLSRRSRKE
ncbi:MAG: hypothetical protein SPI72_02910 [Porphyromonas sp.]|nr:hypothetical protein [Porphyromonas sp.]